MDFIMEVCGAMLIVSAATVALTLATIFVYATVVIIKEANEERKKSKKKRAKK